MLLAGENAMSGDRGMLKVLSVGDTVDAGDSSLLDELLEVEADMAAVANSRMASRWLRVWE